jgi:hypothetical protein
VFQRGRARVQAAVIHLRNLDDNLSIKPRTRHYWRQRLAPLIKSWPGLNETEVCKITHTDCKKWAPRMPELQRRLQLSIQ